MRHWAFAGPLTAQLSWHTRERAWMDWIAGPACYCYAGQAARPRTDTRTSGGRHGALVRTLTQYTHCAWIGNSSTVGHAKSKARGEPHVDVPPLRRCWACVVRRNARLAARRGPRGQTGNERRDASVGRWQGPGTRRGAAERAAGGRGRGEGNWEDLFAPRRGPCRGRSKQEWGVTARRVGRHGTGAAPRCRSRRASATRTLA